MSPEDRQRMMETIFNSARQGIAAQNQMLANQNIGAQVGRQQFGDGPDALRAIEAQALGMLEDQNIRGNAAMPGSASEMAQGDRPFDIAVDEDAEGDSAMGDSATIAYNDFSSRDDDGDTIAYNDFSSRDDDGDTVAYNDFPAQSEAAASIASSRRAQQQQARANQAIMEAKTLSESLGEALAEITDVVENIVSSSDISEDQHFFLEVMKSHFAQEE